MNSQHSIQANYITDLIEKNQYVSVYLKNGIQLKGWLIKHDSNSLLLKDKVTTQWINKSLVSTIGPKFDPVDMALCNLLAKG